MLHCLQAIEGVLKIRKIILKVKSHLYWIEFRFIARSEHWFDLVRFYLDIFGHLVEMSDARGDEKELDVLEPGEGEGVDGLDRVVIDHHHRDVLWPSEGVSRQGVDS